MRIVSIEEYNEIKPIMQKEMIALAKHEGKNSYCVQTAINNCYARNLSGNKSLYQLFSPGFIQVIERDYLKALIESPEYFGTNNAKDIVHAMFIQAQKNNWVWSEKRFSDYLSNDVFCLLLCRENKEFVKDILRIDLFRHIKVSKTDLERYDFIGGLFHLLKHFAVNKHSASTLPNQNVSLYDVEQLIWPIAKAFFEGTWSNGKRAKTYETNTTYLDKLFTLEFFKEDDSNVSFVNTLIPKSI